MMGAVNVVLLVLLVWTFTAVCEEKDDITVNCTDVTAPVEDKINLNCTVTYLNKGCCPVWYKFMTTAPADDTTICREDFNKDPCIEMSSFSCLYTANKLMTSKFKFHLQTTCGAKNTEFSVIITERRIEPTKKPPVQTDKTTIPVIICVLSCFVIVIVALFLWKRQKTSRSPPDYDMGVSRPPQDCNMCVCDNNISEPSDEEAVLKETSVNVQIEKQCQCNCNHNITSS
ncbi:uncharacterized protein [Paramisgurnus dabryanus]|uniref:uncharacterized protein n=1 Tax=Paramisgurnus dabryanus TaxID=90735 RepID=UPI0031F3AA2F